MITQNFSEKISRDDNSAYFLSEKLLKAIKQSVSQYGNWLGDYPNWDEIVAVCNLETMLTFGVGFEENWVVQHASGIHFEVNLDIIINYIDSRMIINEMGVCEFGEDKWDLFRLLNMIKRFHIEHKFPKFKKFDKYCREIISNNELQTETRWNGPAIVAVAYEYSVLSNLTQAKQNLIEMLMSLRNTDYSWGPTNNPQLNVWHTSQALKALYLDENNDHIRESLDVIDKCVHSDSFEHDYFLRSYYLSYAALGHIYAYDQESSAFDYILQSIFEISQKPNGLNDRGSLSMVAEMLSVLIDIGFNDNACIINKLSKISELEAYQKENIELKRELIALQKQVKKIENSVLINKKLVSTLKWIALTILAAVITAIFTIYVTDIMQGGK